LKFVVHVAGGRPVAGTSLYAMMTDDGSYVILGHLSGKCLSYLIDDVSQHDYSLREE
jgi:hypothetical protein